MRKLVIAVWMALAGVVVAAPASDTRYSKRPASWAYSTNALFGCAARITSSTTRSTGMPRALAWSAGSAASFSGAGVGVLVWLAAVC